MQKAIILFGHGSRDPRWRRPMDAVAARLLAAEPALLVSCAFLELDRPDLNAAMAELVARGASQVTIVPMFFGTGKHAREDLPQLVEALRRSHPGTHLVLQAPVGEDDRLLDLIATIARG